MKKPYTIDDILREMRDRANNAAKAVECPSPAAVATMLATYAARIEAATRETGDADVNERDRLRGELYTTQLELAHAVHSDEQAGKACRKWAEEYRALREERDRLRDIVRRLVSSLSVHHSATMAAVMSNREEFDTPDFRSDIDADVALLREARAAIGEDKP